MANDPIKTDLLEWLREAHAMEEHGQTMLEGRAKRLDAYPELKTRLLAHVQKTEAHQRLIVDCIQRLDGSTSKVKDVGGKLSALGHSWGTALAGEEAVQSNTASFAFANFEVANYRALAVAAEAAGEPAIKQVCEDLGADEQALADWLADNLAETTRAYLQRTAGSST